MATVSTSRCKDIHSKIQVLWLCHDVPSQTYFKATQSKRCREFSVRHIELNVVSHVFHLNFVKPVIPWFCSKKLLDTKGGCLTK